MAYVNIEQEIPLQVLGQQQQQQQQQQQHNDGGVIKNSLIDHGLSLALFGVLGTIYSIVGVVRKVEMTYYLVSQNISTGNFFSRRAISLATPPATAYTPASG